MDELEFDTMLSTYTTSMNNITEKLKKVEAGDV